MFGHQFLIGVENSGVFIGSNRGHSVCSENVPGRGQRGSACRLANLYAQMIHKTEN